jgi:hypothetical protein
MPRTVTGVVVTPGPGGGGTTPSRSQPSASRNAPTQKKETSAADDGLCGAALRRPPIAARDVFDGRVLPCTAAHPASPPFCADLVGTPHPLDELVAVAGEAWGEAEPGGERRRDGDYGPLGPYAS